MSGSDWIKPSASGTWRQAGKSGSRLQDTRVLFYSVAISPPFKILDGNGNGGGSAAARYIASGSEG